MKEVCIECGMWVNVSGCGLCELCEDDVRERSLNGEMDKGRDVELLEEWSKLGFEMVSVEVVEV